MNCRPNDRAIFVGCDPGQEHVLGRLCTVGTSGSFLYDRRGQIVFAWNIHMDLPTKSSQGPIIQKGFAADSFLRPIRDQDGQDEMIKLAGLPPPVYLKAPEWVDNPVHKNEFPSCWPE